MLKRMLRAIGIGTKEPPRRFTVTRIVTEAKPVPGTPSRFEDIEIDRTLISTVEAVEPSRLAPQYRKTITSPTRIVFTTGNSIVVIDSANDVRNHIG